MDVKDEVVEEKDTYRDPAEFLKKIRNKQIRSIQYKKLLKLKKKKKKDEKQKRDAAGLPKGVPHTIESLREPDETTIGNLEDEDNKEVMQEIANNEFASYFTKSYEPKVLITFSGMPDKRTRLFSRELCRIIPNSICRKRNHIAVKKIVKSCVRESFTDILIINENMKQPNGLMIIHLPDGPTANFRLSNVKISSELRRNYKEMSSHRPEVILNNFGTRLGNTVASMLAALFHYDPQFKGRRAVTFHNQRDYIFFRHHRYEFKQNGQVRLRELGPRFTLKLRSLQVGTFDSKTGEYEWIISGRRHEMETSRRKFFL